MAALRVAVASDTAHAAVQAIVGALEVRGCELVRGAGVNDADPQAWPDVAEQVGRLVASGAVRFGVVCCWTGTGVSIAANKIPGVRAALCRDAETARGARRWNDANVLAVALDGTTEEAARAIVDGWMEVAAADVSERANIERVAAMERRYRDGARA